MTQHRALSSNINYIDLAAYFAGECSESERRRVDAWIRAVPEREQEVAQLRQVWEARVSPVWDGQAFWESVREHLPSKNTGQWRGTMVSSPVKSRSWQQSGWYTALAAIAAVLLLVAYGHGPLSRLMAPAAPHAVTTYATTNGQRATITLPDSSTVVLNVASTLQVPMDYARGNRAVRLSGEALFKVVHHGKAPFTVVTDASTTRVLGTSFVVRHYATDSATTIAVQDGKVAMRSIVLAANQQVDIARGGATRVHQADPSIFGFATGVLVLNSVSLPKAIVELNRWYDADIRLGDASLATRRLTDDCAAGSLADLANILELALDVRVVRDGRVLTLYPR